MIAVFPDEGFRPLDLSVAEAQSCPGSVPFYGQVYEGDAFVWCLDKSGSMAWSSSGFPPIVDMKAAVIAALGDLTPSQEFSIISFGGSGYITFSVSLLRATSANIASAQAWVSALPAAGGRMCPIPHHRIVESPPNCKRMSGPSARDRQRSVPMCCHHAGDPRCRGCCKPNSDSDSHFAGSAGIRRVGELSSTTFCTEWWDLFPHCSTVNSSRGRALF